MDNILAAFLAGGPRCPDGCVRCWACGYVYQSPERTQSGNRQPRGRITISGCPDCGHIMRFLRKTGTVRDLTRAEAANLADGPDFAYMRGVVERRMLAIGKWG